MAKGENSLLAITVIGKDQPGIAAAATKVLFDAGCNLEDVTSTILRGHFSMTMIVASPDKTPEELEAALRPAADRFGLVASVGEVADADVHIVAPTHMVSVYGADRPGIVYAVAELLARRGANITDLTSRVIGADDQPVYALMLEVALRDPDAITGDLSQLRTDLGVDVSIHPIEPDLL